MHSRGFLIAPTCLLTGVILLAGCHRSTQPATGLAALHVPAGFEVVQVAGQDLVSYPMMGTLDEKGRLFLCESSGNTLNNQQMASKPDYRIRLLEDRNGDGVYDHSTVFADHLTIPAGAVWNRGALYVASPPDVFRFEDTNQDGVADKKEAIVTGWTMSSNAASLHGPFFGPDGWLYLTDGRHGFHIKTKDGKQFDGMASRIWRVRPDGTGLEAFAGGGFDNPVEVTFTPAGEMIGTMTYFKDPENGERDALLHFVEGGVYPKWYSVVSEFKRTGDLMPVMTKFARIAPAGLLRYRGKAFGQGYEGNLFSAQFNPHRVQRHVVYREGSTFRTEDEDFLTSMDPDFHPTEVIEDADGSMLVFDTGAWFIHGCPISRVAKPEIKGGIYRIRKKGAPAVADPRGEKLQMSKLAPAELAKLLEDERPFVRDQAVELLVAAGEPAVEALANLRKSSGTAEARAAAVFALYRIGTAGAQAAVRAALEDADFEVRTAAARSAGMAGDQQAVERLMAMAKADHPVVRRQAAAALGQIGDPRAVPALLAAATDVPDRFVEHSLIYSLITLKQPGPVAAALRAPEPSVRKAALIALDQMDHSPLKRDQVAGMLRSEQKDLRAAALWVVSHHEEWAGVVLQYLNARLRDPQLGEGEQDAVRDAVRAFRSDVGAQKLVAGLLADPKLPESRTLFLLDTIDSGSIREFPDLWVAQVGKLLDSPHPDVRLRAVELVRERNLPVPDEPLARIADDGSAPDRLRATALGVLVVRKPQLSEGQYQFLAARVTGNAEAVLRQTAAQALGRSTLSKAQLLTLAKQYLPQADPLTLTTLLECFRKSNDPEVGSALIAVLRKSSGALGSLGEDRLKAILAGYPAATQEESKPLFVQLANAQKERIQKLQQLAPLLTAGGDVGRGRHIFFGEKVGCSGCHTIGREGGHVGPDLTGIGAIRSGHDLLEAVVYPSASFVPGFEVYNVDTGLDRLTGVIRSQSRDAVVLVTGPNGEVRIPRSKIGGMARSTVSLMPEGFDQTLSKEELTDLLAFLQSEKQRPPRAGL
ncbi:MAG TPA: PVC-type heme-binding CxxCH protein [Bryobacteraceae bacterium]|nr:PVC-type heme-binding CxxCH protein [Bryobacteraceae bacterium]